ncbi:MAG: glutamate-cysteine ligase family protein [Myxococcota bacterium]|nr:glutamate-cysteine ligase family protein [Myxococcota bacterium]
MSLTRTSILEAFQQYGASKEHWRIGGEYERMILRPDGGSVGYEEAFGIRWFLLQFAKRHGWKPKLEGQNVIALYKDGASITLEPGGQFELSGAPHYSLLDLETEFETNRRHLNQLCKESGLVTATCGLTPYSRIESIRWMPKGRYGIMREYLPKKGELAHYMMKGTCSVQCNYDFSSEQDCAQKVLLCAGIAPVTTAMFANSPLYMGRPTSYMSFRGHIWTHTDPDRTGFPPGLREDFSYERWVDYLLDVPMMFIYRDHWIHAQGTSFRTFMEKGIDGHFPTEEDWNLHMTSVFPEVRIKRTIEVRGADCVSHELALAFCALFSGLLYSEKALSQALAVQEEFCQYGTREERFQIACKGGLEGQVGNRSLADWAEKILDIAQAGLEEWQPEGAHLLKPLVKQVASGESPAATLLRVWKRDPSPKALLRYLAY